MTPRSKLFPLRVYLLPRTPLPAVNYLCRDCCRSRSFSLVQYQARTILSR